MKELEISVDVGEVDMDTVVTERMHPIGEGDYEAEPVTLGHLVAEMVTNRIVQKSALDGDFYGLKRRITDVQNEVIREKVEPLIEEAINSPIRKTNVYGEPTSAATTLREEIMAQTQQALGSRSNNSMNREKTLLQKIVEEEVNRKFTKELNDAIAAEKEKVIAAVRGQAAKVLTDALEKGVRFP